MGLAQLHQLRGRVGRGTVESTCVLLYAPPLTPIARERLGVLRDTNDGFEIARRDLELRGPGELLGTRQTGLMQLRVADLVRDADLLPGVQRAADLMLARRRREHSGAAAPLGRATGNASARFDTAGTDAMRNAADIDRQSRATAHARPSRLREYARLMRLDRPIGIWLLLWPVLWALWIAGDGHPDERLFVIFVLGTFVMRSAGCVMNDFADREFDPHVRRTADRPLAQQSVSPAEALGLFAVLALIALALVIPLNRPTQVLALIGGVLAVTYPFLKRFFSLPQAYLGAAFGWSVPMAFAAQTGSVPPQAWVLFLSVVLWTTAYDTMYAMVDREDDLVIGIRSSAILFGRARPVVIGALQAGALGGLALVGWLTSPRPLVLGGAADGRGARRAPAGADPRPRARRPASAPS